MLLLEVAAGGSPCSLHLGAPSLWAQPRGGRGEAEGADTSLERPPELAALLLSFHVHRQLLTDSWALSDGGALLRRGSPAQGAQHSAEGCLPGWLPFSSSVSLVSVRDVQSGCPALACRARL